jgi:hypothetical protein
MVAPEVGADEITLEGMMSEHHNGSTESIFDLAPEDKDLFPAHGWATTLKGFRCVRLPVAQLYQPGSLSHDIFVRKNIAGVWLQSRSPVRTLRQLGVCLRDLHLEIREILPLQEMREKPVIEARNKALTKQIEGFERTEVLLILAFTLLRRLADELVYASKTLSFRKLAKRTKTDESCHSKRS